MQPFHTQAGNFADFIMTGVDARTGQFMLALALPTGEANLLAGPSLVPVLSFNSLASAVDNGFGLGWSLGLSVLDLNPDAPSLALSSGERFAVDLKASNLQIGGRLAFLDQKLRCLNVTRLASDRFRIDLRSGESEILAVTGNDGRYRLCERRSPEGRRVRRLAAFRESGPVA